VNDRTTEEEKEEKKRRKSLKRVIFCLINVERLSGVGT